jgi:tape measure domain-containing protein
MADLKRSIEIIFEGNDQASRKAADVLAKVRELEQASTGASTAGGKLANELDNVGKKAEGVNLLNTALGALATKLVVDRFIEANVQIEQFDKAIKAVKGTSADTGKELDYLRGLAGRFGVELGALTKTYTSLTAATVGTNLEGQATRNIFEAVTKAMAATGKSSEETGGALRAIEQIAGKGKVQMEELRGQLGDRLPGAMQIAARAMGTTTAGLEDIVKGGLSASEFLPRFAAEIERTFNGATFDGYVNSMARLRNAVDEALVDIGNTGAFEGLTRGVNAVTAILTGATSTVKLFGEQLAAIAVFFEQGLTGKGFDLSALGFNTTESLNKAASSTRSLVDALTGAKPAAQEAAQAVNEFSAETKLLQAQNDAASKATAELDGLLKRLGVNPKKFQSGIEEIVRDLEALANNPAVTGDKFLAGFEAALKRVRSNDDINQLGAQLTKAFLDGKIGSDAFNIATVDLAKATAGVAKASGEATKSVDAQAKALAAAEKAAQRAEERQQQFRLELEKLASNERIKNIEAKVSLNIADLQEQTKRVQALIGSIDNTVNNTGDLLKSLFGQLQNFGTLDWGARRLVEEQINLENQRRQQALNLQKSLTEAQVKYLNAQASSLERGDAVIKVDGAGLQPHLEAFMWEILRTIQIRTNADGLQMLLGV